MTNDPRIEALLNRLPELDEEERALKIESSACAFPQMTDSGAVEMIISDASRLAEIREEMAAPRAAGRRDVHRRHSQRRGISRAAQI